METLTGLYIPPVWDDAPMIVTIPKELAAFQMAVGGYIEIIGPSIMRGHNVIMMVNEEGRLLRLPINKNATYCFSGLKNQYMNEADPRVILGAAVIIGADGDDFVSLTDSEIETLQLRLSEVCDKPFKDWRWA